MMGFIRRIVDRIWWGEEWAPPRPERVELDTVAVPESQGKAILTAANGAVIHAGDFLTMGPCGLVAGEVDIVGRAIEDFRRSDCRDGFVGKVRFG